MKLAVKLLLMVSSVVIVLTLALHGGEQQVTVNAANQAANQFKANHQQYERIQKPTLVVNNKANIDAVELRK